MSDSYREVADRLKNFIVERSATLAPNQDIVPMWELISRRPGQDTMVFDPDNAAMPMIPAAAKEAEAHIVAHMMFGWLRNRETGQRNEVAMVMVVDAERCELWTARVIRSERSPIIGPWECFGGSDPSERIGGPVPDIQAVLR